MPDNPNPIYADPNPGVSTKLSTDGVLQDARSNNGLNQIRGTDIKGATSYGIPKQVTNVGASISAAASGTTSTVRVTFHRDPSDKSYAAAAVWVKGYQGNNNPVQVASSFESPATFVLNNTGEPVSILVQATGNGGQAPLSSTPTTGVRLPKSTVAGYGTTTTVAYTPASPPPASTVAAGTPIIALPSTGPGGGAIGAINIGVTNSCVVVVPGHSLQCRPTTWTVSINPNSASVQVTSFNIAQCTRDTGIVLSSTAIKFGGSAAPLLAAGESTSDVVSLDLDPSKDYYFRLLISTGGLMNELQPISGCLPPCTNTYAAITNQQATNPIVLSGGTNHPGSSLITRWVAA